MKTTTIKTRSAIIAAFIVFVLGGHFAHAASFSLAGDKDRITINESIRVDVFIDSENRQINTIAGTFNVDSSIVDIDEVMIGNSIVTFWVDQPGATPFSDTIVFSGVVPGGIATEKGYLFSVIMTAKKSGELPISILLPTVLLNDGKGTKISTTNETIIVPVNSDGIPNQKTYVTVDEVPPEKFEITRVRDSALFDHKWFIVFTAQDKNSGVGYYEICESIIRGCIKDKSPYQLSRQSNWYFITVRAFDSQDNVRVAFLISKNIRITVASVIILGILVMIYVFFIKKRRKIFGI